MGHFWRAVITLILTCIIPILLKSFNNLLDIQAKSKHLNFATDSTMMIPKINALNYLALLARMESCIFGIPFQGKELKSMPGNNLN
jgi:hypothetical protein